MGYLRELGLAVVASGLLTGLGFVLINPHGVGSNGITFLIGNVLLFPIMSLFPIFDTYPRAFSVAVMGFAQFGWSLLLVLPLRVTYERIVPLWRLPKEPEE